MRYLTKYITSFRLVDIVFGDFSKYISLDSKSLKYIEVLLRISIYKLNELIYREDLL